MKYLFVFLFLLSGCVVVPVLEGFSKMGLSQGDREKLLPQSVKEFHDALYWSDAAGLGPLIKEDGRAENLQKLRKSIKGVRVVETKTDGVDYRDESNKATVHIILKSYKVPFYVVEDHYIKEEWEFTVSTGWQYVSQTPDKAPDIE